MLVLVCGPPGTGKSTVAERVTDRLNGRRLRTDVVRKERFPDPEYTAAESAAVYDELFDRAREAVEAGDDVVLDGTFRRETLRQRATAVAADATVESRVIRVTCDPETVRERIRQRADDESDADFAIYQKINAEFEPVVAENHILIDNSGPLERTFAAVDDAFPLTATA